MLHTKYIQMKVGRFDCVQFGSFLGIEIKWFIAHLLGFDKQARETGLESGTVVFV